MNKKTDKIQNNITISDALYNWYQINKRELPWRDINDPYKIWISEIILQQTRVNQGLNYYLRFIEQFPNIKKLANAKEDEVLKYWQGLGYYSRARNLHKAAKQLMNEFNGVFPKEYAYILSLSGVGTYTAAAICSFAYNQPYAVLDGNVYRVLSRLFAIETPIDSVKGKKEFETLATELLPHKNPAEHNQAIMEFGALQCVPKSPCCKHCPLNIMCKAYNLMMVHQLPIKSKKTAVSHRFFNYLFIKHEEQTFLQKRIAKDVWQHLYEFPLIETENSMSLIRLLEMQEFKLLFENITKIEILKKTNPMQHILSHRVIHAQFISISISEINEQLSSYIKVPISEIDHFPVSRLMELFLEIDEPIILD